MLIGIPECSFCCIVFEAGIKCDDAKEQQQVSWKRRDEWASEERRLRETQSRTELAEKENHISKPRHLP